MTKKKEDINLDMEAIMAEDVPEVNNVEVENKVNINKIERNYMTRDNSNSLINCLSNTRVIVRYIPRDTNLVHDKRHVLAGGMAEDSVRYFTVPVLRSGVYVDVLTSNEKAYLEYVMGLPINALSIYNKVDNYWSNYMIRLSKFDTYLNLSVPEDYIKYKVLLANKDFICPSMDELNNRRKATYQYVLIKEGDEEKQAVSKVNTTVECYVEYGKIKDNFYKLKTVAEIIDGKPTAANQKIEWLQNKCYEFISNNPKLFLSVVRDEYLDTKVLIKRCCENGFIYKRGNYYYLRDNNQPLCGPNEDPTFNIAAKYLSHPKNQELKFTLEAKLNMK